MEPNCEITAISLVKGGGLHSRLVYVVGSLFSFVIYTEFILYNSFSIHTVLVYSLL